MSSRVERAPVTLVESALAEIAEQRRILDALIRREPEARSALARDAEAVR